MKKSDAVFQLIKSLTRGEKRNFRMMSQLTSGSKKYLKLFDALDKLEEYDEEKVLKQFKKDPTFVRQYAYNKNYLYNSILNSLTYFHKGQEAELSALALQVKILIQKNLYGHARKLLRKVKDKVINQEKFEDLLKLLRMEITILKGTQKGKDLADVLCAVEVEEDSVMDRLYNLQEYQKLETQSFVLMRTRHIARGEKELAATARLLENPLLKSEMRAMSVRARIHYNEIKRRLSHFQGDQKSCVSFSHRVIDLYEGNPEILENYKIEYLKQLSYLPSHYFNLKQEADGLRCMNKFSDVELNTPQEKLIRFQNYYLLLLIVQLEHGGGFEAGALIQKITKEMESLKSELSEVSKLVMYHALSSYYLTIGNYSESLRWNNEVLNYPKTRAREDLQSIGRILNLLIHLELENYDLVEYSLKSVHRFISNRGGMYKFEKRMLTFIQEYLNFSFGNKTILYTRLQADLEEIMKDPFEMRVKKDFNALAWVESKIRGVHFCQVLREQSSIKSEVMRISYAS